SGGERPHPDRQSRASPSAAPLPRFPPFPSQFEVSITRAMTPGRAYRGNARVGVGAVLPRPGDGEGTSPQGSSIAAPGAGPRVAGRVGVLGRLVAVGAGVRVAVAEGDSERVAVAGAGPLTPPARLVAVPVGRGEGVRVGGSSPCAAGVTVGRRVGVRSASRGEMGFTSVATGPIGWRTTSGVAVGSTAALAVAGWRLSARRLAAPKQYSDDEVSRSTVARPRPTRCQSFSQSYRSHAQFNRRSTWALRCKLLSFRRGIKQRSCRQCKNGSRARLRLAASARRGLIRGKPARQ